jgi:3-isopropylmalate/(R)-2-methylmalate dehydratase small subunit
VKFERIKSSAVLLPLDDVDTDQIIPARFLKTINKDGLGKHLFADWRYSADGEENADFALTKPSSKGACILITGVNFGCGSSREHAAWALVDWGIKAVIAQSFADIFRTNALKNGLLPIAIAARIHDELVEMVAANPDAQLIVDLIEQQLVFADGTSIEFPLDPFAKRILLEGINELEYIRSFEEAISAYEAEHD